MDIQIPWAVLQIPKPRIPDFASKISRIPESQLPYTGSRGDGGSGGERMGEDPGNEFEAETNEHRWKLNPASAFWSYDISQISH